jgi:cobalt transporter subunit CbtB
MSTQVSNSQTTDQAHSLVSGNVSSLAQTMAAVAFGAIVLFAVGFLPTDAAHNAAHDTRHALAFPCH